MPVAAQAHMSRPSRATGIVAAWMAVGCWNSIAVSDCNHDKQTGLLTTYTAQVQSIEVFSSTVHPFGLSTGIFGLKCRIVYFQCGVKMTGASSKIDVRRLKVGIY